MRLLASVFLGWSLGANDAANVFGTAVSAQMIRWRTAAILIAVFVIVGAFAEGGGGLETLGGITNQTLNTAFCASLGAALTVTLMTLARIPISTSQAVVGAIIGTGLASGQEIHWQQLNKVIICWIGTPLGAALLAIILYPALAFVVRKSHLHFFRYDRLMRRALVVAGIYGAYALGANNVANVTGVFYQTGAFENPVLNPMTTALLIGGVSIALGALTFSRNVMLTVGKNIIPLDAFSAFIVVASEAITVHIYAMIGVPVSTSQAVVGAVIGIGLLKGMRTVSFATLGKIALGWMLTPVLGGGVAWVLYKLF